MTVTFIITDQDIDNAASVIKLSNSDDAAKIDAAVKKVKETDKAIVASKLFDSGPIVQQLRFAIISAVILQNMEI